jgi:Kef-type K+ transport system membrane component KefB
MDLLVFILIIIVVAAIFSFLLHTLIFLLPVIIVCAIVYAIYRYIMDRRSEKKADHNPTHHGNNEDGEPEVIDVDYTEVDDEDQKKE